LNIVYQYIDPSDASEYGIQEIINYVYSGSPASELSNWNYYSKNADPAYPDWTLFKQPSSTNFEPGSKNFIVFNDTALSNSLLIIDVGREPEPITTYPTGTNIVLSNLEPNGSLYNQAILGAPNGWFSTLNPNPIIANSTSIQWPDKDYNTLAHTLRTNTTDMQFMNLDGTTFQPYNSDGSINELTKTPQLCYQNWGHAYDGSNYVYYTPSLWMPPGGGDLSITVDQDFDYNITTTYFKIYETGAPNLYKFINERIISTQNTHPTKVFNYFFTALDSTLGNVICQNEQIMILITEADGEVSIEGKLKSSYDQTGAGFPFIRAETAMTFWLGFLGGGSYQYPANPQQPSNTLAITQNFYKERAEGNKRFNKNIKTSSTYSVPLIPNTTTVFNGPIQSNLNFAIIDVSTNIVCSDMVEAIQGWVNGNILGITTSGNTRIKNLNFSGGIPRGQSPLQPNGYNAYLANTDAQQLGSVTMENVNILNNWLGQTDGPDIISPNTSIENCLIRKCEWWNLSL
jgi:hypothetical protein